MAHYVGALLSFLRGVTEEEVAAIRRDDARIRQFFAAYTKPEKVGGGIDGWSVCVCVSGGGGGVEDCCGLAGGRMEWVGQLAGWLHQSPPTFQPAIPGANALVDIRSHYCAHQDPSFPPLHPARWHASASP